MKKNFKKYIFILFIFVFISICLYKTYILLRCSSANFAVEYFAKNNKKFEISSLIDTDIVFSSDDLLIYELTELDKDFDIEKIFTLKLKKHFNFWFLDSINTNI